MRQALPVLSEDVVAMLREATTLSRDLRRHIATRRPGEGLLRRSPAEEAAIGRIAGTLGRSVAFLLADPTEVEEGEAAPMATDLGTLAHRSASLRARAEFPSGNEPRKADRT